MTPLEKQRVLSNIQKELNNCIIKIKALDNGLHSSHSKLMNTINELKQTAVKIKSRVNNALNHQNNDELHNIYKDIKTLDESINYTYAFGRFCSLMPILGNAFLESERFTDRFWSGSAYLGLDFQKLMQGKNLGISKDSNNQGLIQKLDPWLKECYSELSEIIDYIEYKNYRYPMEKDKSSLSDRVHIYNKENGTNFTVDEMIIIMIVISALLMHEIKQTPSYEFFLHLCINVRAELLRDTKFVYHIYDDIRYITGFDIEEYCIDMSLSLLNMMNFTGKDIKLWPYLEDDFVIRYRSQDEKFPWSIVDAFPTKRIISKQFLSKLTMLNTDTYKSEKLDVLVALDGLLHCMLYRVGCGYDSDSYHAAHFIKDLPDYPESADMWVREYLNIYDTDCKEDDYDEDYDRDYDEDYNEDYDD